MGNPEVGDLTTAKLRGRGFIGTELKNFSGLKIAMPMY
jgi:hypothetical protein